MNESINEKKLDEKELDEKEEVDVSWYCYIIKSSDINHKNLSYNGSTNNIVRRIRQHNGEIKGGAVRTQNGRKWIFYAVLKGLPNHKNALSCEWRIRYPDNKRNKENRYKGVNGRIVGLNEVLQLEKWTNPCVNMNRDMKLELYIVREYVKFIEIDKTPKNIKIIIVDFINEKDLM